MWFKLQKEKKTNDKITFYYFSSLSENLWARETN